MVQCGVLGFCVGLFYSIFNEFVCFSASTCFNEAFYLSTSINLSASLSCSLLELCVGFLFYFKLSSMSLYVSMTFFCFKQPFYLSTQSDSMDCGILCSKVLIIQ
jgi:hypothetical protein